MENKNMNIFKKIAKPFAASLALAALFGTPAQAHHSFAMYDMRNIRVFTGVVTRVDPAANHLAIFFAPMNEERKNVLRDEDGEPIVWSVEMQGSAAMARQGVSVNSFPAGTVFSVALHPLRNGENAGSREGGLFKCPERTPPEPGMHCDSVEGSIQIGNEPLTESTLD
ncbi:MAG: hypothetical protein EBS81_01295 [Gammaproteobacteria bacterium]|nr:hypothetical protein [Gammaproteobacteria bacterium]